MSRSTRTTDAPTRLAAALDWFAGQFVRRFEVDLRALAALRVALGALVLTDLLLRTRSLVAFHTDRGVLPLSGYEAYYGSDFTIHALSGAAWFQALLFVVAGAFAVSLILGYRTRTVTFLTWVLLLSLHGRNSMVLNGGDKLFRMMLFWGIFVPLGERWSVDARRHDRDRRTLATVGTMALLAQVVLVYFVNAIHKLSSDEWMSGEAVVYIMQLDQFSVLLGPILAEFPPILRAVTYVWVALVVLSPLLLVFTGWRRGLFATAFVGMHLGMFLSMKLGIFPLISIAALLPFYPPLLWDALERRANGSSYASRLGDGLDRLAGVLPDPHPVRFLRSVAPVGLPSARPLLSTIVPWIVLTLVIMSNAQSVDYADNPEPAEEALEYIEADQSWQMFAPNPLTTTHWYVAPGNLTDGTRVDALHGGAVDLDRPPNAADTFPSARWRKYMGNVNSLDHTNHPSYLASHLCDRWNRSHDTELANLTLITMEQPETPYSDEPAPVSRDVLQEYDCSGTLVQAG